MSTKNIIFTLLSPQTKSLINSISEETKKGKTTKHQKKAKKETKKETKRTKKETEQVTKNNKKDICQQDCICESIINKKTENIKNTDSYNLSNMTNEELKKYILFSDVLGTPVCKKRRMY